MREPRVTPIAVIGMACRLPGGIDSPALLWEALLRGDDLVTECPQGRWGAFLDGPDLFDCDFFGIGEREAVAIDPQQLLLLEVSHEAVDHAGLTAQALAGSATGVFAGVTHRAHAIAAADSPTSTASERVAHAMGLHGPAMTVDAGCSSGLAAVHLACRSLHEGESDLALAAGVALMPGPHGAAGGSAPGTLSATGRCRDFDIAADGFVPGEGCAALVLKRLPAALADGDRVLGVIRGTAANQDGHAPAPATLSRPVRVAVYRRALAVAGVDADTVGMVEAHGAGTPGGDPVEYASVAEVYGTAGACALASVETNVGHTGSASGVLGLMKAVLAVEHGLIPRHLHFDRLTDDLGGITTNLFVPRTTTPWPPNGEAPRRAAVSSYGFSGTNVHAIVEQAPAAQAPTPADSEAPATFLLSASSADALRETARRFAGWAHTRAHSLAPSDLAYTLARRRTHRSVRTAVVASGVEELIAGLLQVAGGDIAYRPAVGQDDRGPVWLFSGQGSRWAATGAALLANEPVFVETVAELEPLIAAESGFSVTDTMTAPHRVTGVHRTQPTLFATQVALAAVLRSYGVTPGGVIGHSTGEAAAAVVAGALSPEDGVRLVCRRASLLAKVSGSAAMASVDLPARGVQSELTALGVHDVVVAVVTSPLSTVIAGPRESVRMLVEAWERRGVPARESAVDVAAHCPRVDPILDELSEALAGLRPMTPRVPYYSATLFDPREQPACDAAYWVDNLRHTVRFSAAVRAALDDGHRVFAELSPHPTLTHAVEQTAGSGGLAVAAVASLRRGMLPPHGLRGVLADLYSAGAAVDLSSLYPDGRLLDVPPTAWTHRQPLYRDVPEDDRPPGGVSVAVHPLLGAHVPLPEEPERHAWHADVGTGELPWLDDHRMHNAVVFPEAAYCEMAVGAANTVLGEGSEVRDLRFEAELLLDKETPVSAVASVTAPGFAEFTVTSREEGTGQVRRASAVLHAACAGDEPPSYDLTALLAAHPCRVDGGELRRGFDDAGVRYGPAFAGLAAAHLADGRGDTVLAELAPPDPIRSQRALYGIHPALLDACFQSIAAHPEIRDANDGGPLLPLGARRLRAYAPACSARYCYARVTCTAAGGAEADLEILDARGTVLMSVGGLRLRPRVGASRDRALNERLLTIEWQRREPPDAPGIGAGAGRWLLVSTSTTADVVATALTDALTMHGAECTSMCWPWHADGRAAAELRDGLTAGACAGVVVITGSHHSGPEQDCAVRGAEHVRHLVRIARALSETAHSARLYVVTRATEAVLADDRVNLEQGGLRGLLRVLGAEHPHLRVTHIDVDDRANTELLARQLLAGADDDETAWRNDQWYTARLCRTPLRPDDRHTTVVDAGRDGVRAQVRTPGDRHSVELVACDRVRPGPGQIEVAVGAAGVDGAGVPAVSGKSPGVDFAGVVTAVAPDVTAYQVGDRVAGMSPDGGCWGGFVTCDARLAATIPAALSDAQAAAVTTAHATAWYGLRELARIKAGDKVLIHPATGGLGQAAIGIARAAGAQVFATAGAPEHRKLLYDLGIEHVYDSHGVEFADRIRRDTDGYGVDVVVNSLAGAARLAGLRLLASRGRFVEIGQRDTQREIHLGAFPFDRNVSFHAVDLGLLCATHPEEVRALLETVYTQVAEGTLPTPTFTSYPLSQADKGIGVVRAAESTGASILDIPRGGRIRVVLPPERVQPFRPDGSYIITGGLGGRGLFLAEKMAEAGCGRIVLNSRSDSDDTAQETVERIRAIGSEIVVECGDIARTGTADRLVAVATATGLPVRGVLHAAAAVEDATLTDVTDESLERDWAPKAHGVWHLHHATAGQPLDWFCSFSSAAALLGSPGRGGCAASDSWLDAFTRWRRAQGLPAIAIAWGGGAAIAPDDAAYAVNTLLRHNRAHSGYAAIAAEPRLARLAERSPFYGWFQAGEDQCSTSRFRAELSELPRDAWRARLGQLVFEQAGMILRRTVDPDRPLPEYGLDSLGALELRTRIETETGIPLAPKNISTTVHGLAEYLYKQLASETPGQPRYGSQQCE